MPGELMSSLVVNKKSYYNYLNNILNVLHFHQKIIEFELISQINFLDLTLFRK